MGDVLHTSCNITHSLSLKCKSNYSCSLKSFQFPPDPEDALRTSQCALLAICRYLFSSLICPHTFPGARYSSVGKNACVDLDFTQNLSKGLGVSICSHHGGWRLTHSGTLCWHQRLWRLWRSERVSTSEGPHGFHHFVLMPSPPMAVPSR